MTSRINPTPHPAASAFTGALFSAFKVRFGNGDPATRRRNPDDIRHLDDRMLKDIGYGRVDKMGPGARNALNSLTRRQLW